MQSTKTVIIVGIPRSGTSVTAGIVNSLGIHMNGNKTPSKHNPNGCFEDVDFVNLDKYIVKKMKGQAKFIPGTYWFSPPTSAQISKGRNIGGRRIKKLFDKKNKHESWGWKHPMITLTFRNYINYIKNPYIIVAYRDHLEIAKSLSSFHGVSKLSINERLKIISYNQQLISFYVNEYNHIPTLMLSFNDVVEDSVSALKKIISFLEIKPNTLQITTARELIIPRREIEASKKRVLKKNRIDSGISALYKIKRKLLPKKIGGNKDLR